MKTPRWICATCRQPFTRRWNANRHCNNKHFGKIENIISFTEYMTNRTNSSIALNCSFYEDKNSHPHPINVKEQLIFDNEISANNNNNNNLSYNTIADPFDNFLDRELLPSEILESLSLKYQEMQHLLDSLPDPYRQTFLDIALISAINSDNPINIMQQKLIEYRNLMNSGMLLRDIASLYGQDKEFIKEFLRFKNTRRNSR